MAWEIMSTLSEMLKEHFPDFKSVLVFMVVWRAV